MPSNPLPVNLPQECRKAQKIFQSFVDPHNGLDHVVPPSVLRRAKGFCLMSVAKAGFGFSARAGSGVVIARLEDGSWSAPSAVGTAGGGFGFQAGVELAEFLIILNSRAAVKTFMTKGSLMVGGNLSVAAGPLGRNVEGTGSLSAKGKVAAMYSYSRTKGLFGGASVEGSVLVERSDANAKAYGANVTAAQLLSGAIDPPEWAYGLITTISNLATGSVALPGGGWGLDSPMNTPTPGAEEDIDGDEEGYFARSRIEREKARREEADRTEHGLTPREYQERGYAFANSYSSGGSGKIGSPDKERSQIRSVLGAVGRNRSGSGGSKKSSSTPPTAVEDPFAGGDDYSASQTQGPVHAGYTNFETQFSNNSDDEGSARQPRFTSNSGSGSGSGSMSRNASSTGVRNPSPDALRGRGDRDLMTFGTSDPRTESSRSPNGSRNRSRAGSTASTGGGGGGWFNRNSRPKMPKSKSSNAASSGLRERAEQMKWGTDRDGSAVLGTAGSHARESFDSFDDLDDDDAFGGRPRYENGTTTTTAATTAREPAGRFRASTVGAGGGTASAFDRAALSNQGRNRSSSSPLKPRENVTYGPFDSNSSLGSSTEGGALPSRADRTAYSAKPWDSEDELFASPPPQLSSVSARGSGTSTPVLTAGPGRARSGTNASSHSAAAAANALDLRQVEADFAGVMSLSKHGGSGEVGSYSAGVAPRSRSSTIGAGAAAGAGTGSAGRSRSGTAGGGIGTAIALYDFAGVEPTDLPFKKGDVITILARDDEEWWKGRLRLREGMIPRNYVEAHFA